MAVETIPSAYTPENNPSSENIHRIIRKAFIFIGIFLFLITILFLMYHNGKSIYDNGL